MLAFPSDILDALGESCERVRSRGATLTPENTVFIVVSFEGPDAYSQAGGLGVRVSGLVDTLAALDYETHLFFIGDPAAPGESTDGGGRLVLHRWAQWISANCPGGVYDGEAAKFADVTRAMPPYLIDRLAAPAIAAGRIPVFLFEEWQTAACAATVSAGLDALGLRDRAVLVWNANNPYGFERIDWLRLASTTTITTISRHMRSIVRACGADARVIPNGIPDASFDPVQRRDVARVRGSIQQNGRAGALFKMARWEREKGWTQSLDAIATARADAARRASDDASRPVPIPILIARSGGPTGRGAGLDAAAHARGLRVVAFDTHRELATRLGDAVRAGTDVVSLRFGVTPPLARLLYAASDGVLANSVSEPFGLVGLEAMAAGGVAFTGGTGEDYAMAGRNAVVLETLDPAEILARWDELSESADFSARLRRAARKTARRYQWTEVAAMLLGELHHQARRQRLLRDCPRQTPPRLPAALGLASMARRVESRIPHTPA